MKAVIPVAAVLMSTAAHCQPVSATTATVAESEEVNQAEIVVTAERTNRKLERTAASVVVQTAAQIAARAGDTTTNDLVERIPNIVLARNSNLAPAIRGIDGTGPAIGGNAFFAGTRPRLNYLVDGRTLTFNEAVYIDGGIWDIQQLEVYRGAQSLLQGRNSIAGVIAIKTADPTFDWQAKARAELGSYDFQRYGVALGGPLVGQSLAFRIAGEFRREDTFVKVDPAIAVFDHPRRSESKTLRGKLLLAPAGTPEFRSLLTLSYADAYAPQIASVRRPFADLGSGITSATVGFPRFRTRAATAISDTSWQVADVVRLSTFLTATDFRIDRYIQPTKGISRIDGREYSVEPRITVGGADSPVSGFLAGYLFRSNQREFIDFLGPRNFRDRTHTDAVFGELSWKPSPLVDLTGGLRYETERRDRTGGATIFSIDYHREFSALLPRGVVTLHPDDNFAIGASVTRGYNAGGAGFVFSPPFASFIYDKEMVWDYEGFARWTTAGGRLHGSANIFYNDYSGLQLPFDISTNPAVQAIIIRNARRASTYGAEAEVRYAALAGLDLSASAGLLHTRVNRFPGSVVEGKDLPRSPAFSFTAGIVGRPVEPIAVSFDLRYSDAYYSDVFNTARGRTKPYFTGNARVSYRIGPTSLFVGATNIFDSLQPIYLVPGATVAADIGYLLPPRRVIGGIDLAF